MNASLDPAAEQAIDWLMTLRVDPAQRPQFEHWLAADAAHEQAWARLQACAGTPMERLRAVGQHLPAHAQQVREALMEPMTSRRSIVRGIAALGLLGSAAWLGASSGPGLAWRADLSTGTAERRRVTLPDGSLLTLNACSAVDLRYTAQERCIVLRLGELLVQAREDARPLRILSSHASVSSRNSGRWMVSQAPAATLVVALSGDAEVGRLGSLQTRTLLTDHALRIDAQGMHALGRQTHQADWVDGIFSAIDAPLETLVEALRPYHRGIIRVSADVRQLRVQGVFMLDQPEQALQTMAQTLPLRVEHYSPWLVLISRRV